MYASVVLNNTIFCFVLFIFNFVKNNQIGVDLYLEYLYLESPPWLTAAGASPQRRLAKKGEWITVHHLSMHVYFQDTESCSRFR